MLIMTSGRWHYTDICYTCDGASPTVEEQAEMNAREGTLAAAGWERVFVDDTGSGVFIVLRRLASKTVEEMENERAESCLFVRSAGGLCRRPLGALTDLPRYESNRERAEKICALRHLEIETPEWFERRNDLVDAMEEAERVEEKRSREIWTVVLAGAIMGLGVLLIFFGYLVDRRTKERDTFQIAAEQQASARKGETERADSCAAREEFWVNRDRQRNDELDTCQKAFWRNWRETNLTPAERKAIEESK